MALSYDTSVFCALHGSAHDQPLNSTALVLRRYAFEALLNNEFHGAEHFFFTPYAQKGIPKVFASTPCRRLGHSLCFDCVFFVCWTICVRGLVQLSQNNIGKSMGVHDELMSHFITWT